MEVFVPTVAEGAAASKAVKAVTSEATFTAAYANALSVIGIRISKQPAEVYYNAPPASPPTVALAAGEVAGKAAAEAVRAAGGSENDAAVAAKMAAADAVKATAASSASVPTKILVVVSTEMHTLQESSIVKAKAASDSFPDVRMV